MFKEVVRVEAVGIICEYNPFHNGHIYHINEIKKMYPEAVIVLVMSGNFTQRGEVSIMDKWKKTDIALDYVDLVVELPFVFSVQSADIFAHGAISILKKLGVKRIVFGTESLDRDELLKIAEVQRGDKFDSLVKSYLDEGVNYPTSLSKAVYDIAGINVESPNDLLGLSYVKELEGTDIEPVTIKRTNDYHETKLEGSIASGTAIRKAILKGVDIRDYVPLATYNYLDKIHTNEDYFDYLKYKIISEIDNLDVYLNVDEGIENRIKKCIYESYSLGELIDKVKTKRYTYNKLNRMFTNILCGFTKDMARKYKDIEYIRVLGFNSKGRRYLKECRKSDIPIITNYSRRYEMLDVEMKVSYIYYINEKDKDYSLMEYKHKPIIK